MYSHTSCGECQPRVVPPPQADWEEEVEEEEVAEGWTPFEKFARANQTAKVGRGKGGEGNYRGPTDSPSD